MYMLAVWDLCPAARLCAAGLYAAAVRGHVIRMHTGAGDARQARRRGRLLRARMRGLSAI